MAELDDLIESSTFSTEEKKSIRRVVFTIEELHSYLTEYAVGSDEDARSTLLEKAFGSCELTYREYVTGERAREKDDQGQSALRRVWPYGALMPVADVTKSIRREESLSDRDPIVMKHGYRAVRNQGHRPTCVAFALLSVLEKEGDDLSEQFVYWATKQFYDSDPRIPGISLAWARAALAIDGVCKEELFEYDDNADTSPTDEAILNAKTNTFRMRLNRTVSAGALYDSLKNGPVALTVRVFDGDVRDNWKSYVSSLTGRVLDPPSGLKSSNLGHCVCLVGFQPDKLAPGGGWFLIRNSWGKSQWGRTKKGMPGYGVMSAEYAELYGVEFCW